jgi:hypothetical protein
VARVRRGASRRRHCESFCFACFSPWGFLQTLTRRRAGGRARTRQGSLNCTCTHQRWLLKGVKASRKERRLPFSSPQRRQNTTDSTFLLLALQIESLKFFDLTGE